MALARTTLTTLAAGLAVVAASGLVSGQPQPLPNRPTAKLNEVAGYKTAGGIPKADLPKAKMAFDEFAKFYADYVSHPKVYTAPQEFRPEPPPMGSPLTVDQLIAEVNRALLVPSPVTVFNPVAGQPNFFLATDPNSGNGAIHADYIRELGTALDKALGEVVKNSTERVVRVNAARLLAAACRSGAQAHYPTVTELIADAKTDPEVRYYALQAAANLLAAYDLNDYKSRRHSHGPQEVGALVAAVQNAVLKPDALLPLADVPVGKEVRKVVAPEQVPVVRFIRRQAVRALAEVRFAELDVDKTKKLYPAHTLALVALSKVPVETYLASADKVEVVAAPKNVVADAADAAEAVLGILNMAPPKGGAAARQYAAPMAEVVAAGVATWAGPRASNPADKSLPWKGTAARLEDGLKTWQGLFDVNFDPTRPAIKTDLVPAPVAGAAKAITDNILTPMGSPTGAVSVTGLQTYLRDAQQKNKGPNALRPFVPPDSPALPQP